MTSANPNQLHDDAGLDRNSAPAPDTALEATVPPIAADAQREAVVGDGPDQTWVRVETPPRYDRRPRPPAPRESFIPVVLALAAVLFNAVLAFVNGNVMPVSPAMVIASEGCILIAATLFAISHYRPSMTLWYVLILSLGVFAVYRMMTTTVYDIKYFRDVFVVATFVVLGMATTERRMIQMAVILQAIICGGVLWEALSVQSFGDALQIKRYYIDTRGFYESQWYAEGSNLFVSAVRPDERFFPFFDLHRLSSFYLEPVSLGNHVVLMTAFIAAFWHKLSFTTRVAMVVGTVFCLLASDGRLAATSSALVVIVSLMRPWTPRNVAVLFLPLAAFFAVIATDFFDLVKNDDFQGRIAITAGLLADLRLIDWMGLSNDFIVNSADAGLVYFIITQSFAGILILWMVVVLGAEEKTRQQQVYKNGICIYLALTMLVSYSFTSIKTAAPLWIIYGSMIGMRQPILSGRLADYVDKAPPAQNWRVLGSRT